MGFVRKIDDFVIIGQVYNKSIRFVAILTDDQVVVLSLIDVHGVWDFPFKGIFDLNHQHVAKLLLPPEQKILGRGVSELYVVDDQFLYAAGVPSIDVRVEK